jgi:competence protein ComEA
MLFDLWERYRVLLITAGAVLFAAVSFLLYDAEQPAEMVPDLPLETPAYAAESEKQEWTPERPGSRQASGPEQKQSDLIVDVKGSVKRPGIYRLYEGERVSAAIEKAGGPLPDADLDRVNLAQPLTDGSVVRIPKKGEAASPCVSLLSPAGPGQVIPNSAGQGAEGKVNINTATMEELMTLPGIGETRAKAILAYRQQRGPFAAPEDLKQVTGIGEKMYERMEARIRVK